GQRVKGSTERDIERAIEERSTVRTWPMRGTLHFVPREDVRWMLRLLAKRVLARAAGRYRQLELDEAVLDKSRKILEKALQNKPHKIPKKASKKNPLPRPEIFAILERNHISTREQRGIHILGNLSMKGSLCIAAHRGKQATFALLDEWAGPSKEIDDDEAFA